MSKKNHPKIGLAIQGSFGHEFYATGIMQAFQAYGYEHGKRPQFAVASGCVEMLAPMLLYFYQDESGRGIDIDTHFQDSLRDYQQMTTPRIILNMDYVNLQPALKTPQQIWTALQRGNFYWDLFKVFSPNGIYEFNPAFISLMRERLPNFFAHASIPVFTNMVDVQNLDEVYLWCGNTEIEKKYMEKLKGSKDRRVEKLDVDSFFASGARPPYFAPRAYGENYFMEGAMRANPPLSPLLDLDADEILLLRFFAKNRATGKITNGIDLSERYLEVIFSAPLQKEIEMIQSINRLLEKNPDLSSLKTQVKILDATDEQEGVPAFRALVENQLDFFSHFEAVNLEKKVKMYNTGQKVGQAILEAYQNRLTFEKVK